MTHPKIVFVGPSRALTQRIMRRSVLSFLRHTLYPAPSCRVERKHIFHRQLLDSSTPSALYSLQHHLSWRAEHRIIRSGWLRWCRCGSFFARFCLLFLSRFLPILRPNLTSPSSYRYIPLFFETVSRSPLYHGSIMSPSDSHSSSFPSAPKELRALTRVHLISFCTTGIRLPHSVARRCAEVTRGEEVGGRLDFADLRFHLAFIFLRL